MTLDELRAWAACPPSKTPAAMSVAGIVTALLTEYDTLKAQQRRHAAEFPALADMRERMEIAEDRLKSTDAELARVRAEKLPNAEWEAR